MKRTLLFAHDDRIGFDDAGHPVSFNYTRNLIDRYRYLADEVTFAVRCEAPRPMPWFDDATIICVSDMKHGRDLMRYHSARQAVRRLVASHDLVVARLPSIIGSWALREAWRESKPALVEMVGCPWDALWNHSPKGKLVAPWFWAKNRRLLRKATHTVYVTESFLQARYPTAGACASCSDVEAVTAGATHVARRRKRWRNVRDGAPIVLATIANVNVPYKGHDLVLRALSALGEQRVTSPTAPLGRVINIVCAPWHVLSGSRIAFSSPAASQGTRSRPPSMTSTCTFSRVERRDFPAR